MLRNICLILFTICLLGKTTDIASLIWAKQKSAVVCDTGTCDNEKTKVEKINDDQVLTSHSVNFGHSHGITLLKNAFAYTFNLRSEIYRILASPPPELS